MPDNNNQSDTALFRQVAGASAEQLREGVATVEGIPIPERDQQDDYNLRSTLKKLRKRALCFGAIVVAVITSVILLLGVVVVCRYLWLISDDKIELAELLKTAINYVFVAASTLCVEHIFKKREL